MRLDFTKSQPAFIGRAGFVGAAIAWFIPRVESWTADHKPVIVDDHFYGTITSMVRSDGFRSPVITITVDTYGDREFRFAPNSFAWSLKSVVVNDA